MKKILMLSAAVAALSAFAGKLPVDEDLFLEKHTSFRCERHLKTAEELLKPPTENYNFPENKIIWDKGMPIIVSNGQPVTLFQGQLMSATNGNPLSARQLREAGINTFFVDIHYVDSKWIYNIKNPRITDPKVIFKKFHVSFFAN